MRLLHAATMQFHEYEGSSIPPYAILSHRWEGEEVSYQELRDPVLGLERKLGFQKIQQCSQQALKDRLQYVWIDTCCIDKSSSAELSEAINSMYAWYQRSSICYVFLSDVRRSDPYKIGTTDGGWITIEPQYTSKVMKSKWWTRGWTLQELIAPQSVVFYVDSSVGWSAIGTKNSLVELIATRTGIDDGVLRGDNIKRHSVAKRMSWAAERVTTRIEDMAYCLLGIFDVNMPLLYGEGSKAFIRLQKEIMRQSDDHTLFAWQLGFDITPEDVCGPLASHPSKFIGSDNLVPRPDADIQSPYSMTNKGLRIELPVLHHDLGPYGFAILHCGSSSSSDTRVALPVVRLGPQGTNRYARDSRYTGPLMKYEGGSPKPRAIFMKQDLHLGVKSTTTGLVITVPTGKSSFFNTICWSTLVTVSESAGGTRSQYRFPLQCRRGAMLFEGRDSSHLLVLFNTEMQHVGRYACKVIHSPPMASNNDTTPEQRRLQEVGVIVQNAEINGANTLAPSLAAHVNAIFAQEVNKEASWSLTHADYGPSNSRQSLVFLPENLAVYAHIDMQNIDGEELVVLNIELQDMRLKQQPLYEIG